MSINKTLTDEPKEEPEADISKSSVPLLSIYMDETQIAEAEPHREAISPSIIPL